MWKYQTWVNLNISLENTRNKDRLSVAVGKLLFLALFGLVPRRSGPSLEISWAIESTEQNNNMLATLIGRNSLRITSSFLRANTTKVKPGTNLSVCYLIREWERNISCLNSSMWPSSSEPDSNTHYCFYSLQTPKFICKSPHQSCICI